MFFTKLRIIALFSSRSVTLFENMTMNMNMLRSRFSIVKFIIVNKILFL